MAPQLYRESDFGPSTKKPGKINLKLFKTMQKWPLGGFNTAREVVLARVAHMSVSPSLFLLSFSRGWPYPLSDHFSLHRGSHWPRYWTQFGRCRAESCATMRQRVSTGPMWYRNLTNSEEPSNFFEAPSSAGESPVEEVVFKAVLGQGRHT